MITNSNQFKISSKIIPDLIKATNELTISPIAKRFKKQKGFDLSNFSLVFRSNYQPKLKFQIRYDDDFVSDKDTNTVKLHRFSKQDDEEMLLHGTVKDFQTWVMSDVIPSYQQKLLKFVDNVDKSREISFCTLQQILANKKLASDFIQLGTQLELLQIYRKDVKFENLIYALLSFIYDYTETRPQYEDEEFAYELDNAILLLSWEIKKN